MHTWAGCRDGWGGFAHLPDPGGFSDQAAWLLDAFAILSAADAELSKQGD